MPNRQLIAREKFLAINHEGAVYFATLEFWKIDNPQTDFVVYLYDDDVLEDTFSFPFLQYAASPNFFHEWAPYFLSSLWNACEIVRCPDES